MPREIEAKIKIDPDEVAEVTRSIELLANDPVEAMRERNDFFDMRNRLRKRGEVLRLRTVQYLNNDVNRKAGERYFVTYKGPVLAGKLKTREEVEVEVFSLQAKLLLGLIGFKPTFMFEKIRHQYTIWSCHVTVDQLPHIGYFVEVEGATESAVKAILKELGLQNRKCIKDGYPSLIRKHFEAKKGKKKLPKSVTF